MSTDTSTTGDVPRKPGAYRPTNHFAERAKNLYDRYDRHLDGDIINTCIRQGELDRQGRHDAVFRHEFDGVTYEIVVNPTNGTVQTGRPCRLDWQTASESDRWTTSQLHDIDEFLKEKYRK